MSVAAREHEAELPQASHQLALGLDLFVCGFCHGGREIAIYEGALFVKGMPKPPLVLPGAEGTVSFRPMGPRK